ncbi:ribosomal protein L2, carboxy-terminal domain protein [Medicago truncatula]|uniref:Ribosomal protein L2, carboxy-terminal domain protein n=2 Tax=IRL clade TaxID=2233839 RepID=A0A072TI39_MEDTR|nr:ribosomal protein L2, carboxy-terminal domain protein [Medicago truncatula]
MARLGKIDLRGEPISGFLLVLKSSRCCSETDCKRGATLKLPSGEVRLISKNSSATVRQVGNVGVNQKSLGRAGAAR